MGGGDDITRWWGSEGFGIILLGERGGGRSSNGGALGACKTAARG
jgi:hypothetical protein